MCPLFIINAVTTVLSQMFSPYVMIWNFIYYFAELNTTNDFTFLEFHDHGFKRSKSYAIIERYLAQCPLLKPGQAPPNAKDCSFAWRWGGWRPKEATKGVVAGLVEREGVAGRSRRGWRGDKLTEKRDLDFRSFFIIYYLSYWERNKVLSFKKTNHFCDDIINGGHNYLMDLNIVVIPLWIKIYWDKFLKSLIPEDIKL